MSHEITEGLEVHVSLRWVTARCIMHGLDIMLFIQTVKKYVK